MQFLKRKSHKKNHAPSAFRSIGREPTIDWFISLICMGFLIVLTALWTGFHFYNTNLFIANLSSQSVATPESNTKTREEQLQDTIKMYEQKKADHLTLLGQSQIETKKEQVELKSASSTASTTSSTQSGSSTAQASSTRN